MAETQVVRENGKWRYSEAKVETLRGVPKKVLSSFLDFFLLSNPKTSTMKAFLDGGLALLTLRARTIL